jgi:serine/threonine protein kinase
LPEIGQTISHYKIVEKLGAGGMGVIYKAEDTRLGRFVALKFLAERFSQDRDALERFQREARAASALNHPNICTIYDIGSLEGRFFIAMEFLEGKTLKEIIRGEPIAVDQILELGMQIADGLHAAHEKGIVHRDLKPSNIMVTEDGAVKVLDFGLAKLTEQSQSDEFGSTATADQAEPVTEKGTIVGTVAYMSPEQAEGKPVDARSDIFSFGSVLYEMVTGKRAFGGDSKIATLSAILNQDPMQVSQAAGGAPPELERIITRCLRKDPSCRFQAMPDLKVALEELKEESESGKLAGRAGAEGPPGCVRGRLRAQSALRTRGASSQRSITRSGNSADWSLNRGVYQ